MGYRGVTNMAISLSHQRMVKRKKEEFREKLLKEEEVIKTKWLDKVRLLQERMDTWWEFYTGREKLKTEMEDRMPLLTWNEDKQRVDKLRELIKVHRPEFIKKKHFLELNDLYKRYRR